MTPDQYREYLHHLTVEQLEDLTDRIAFAAEVRVDIALLPETDEP